MWCLQGGSEDIISEAVSLFKEIPFSTTMTEQAHGSGAIMKRFHQDYTQTTLQVRAFLHSVRALFRPSDFEREDAAIQRQLDRLDAFHPGKVSGLHMFRSDLMRRARAVAEAEGGDPHDVWIPRLVIKNASGYYNELSMREQALYQRRAAEHAEQKQLDVESRRVELLEAQSLLHARLQEERAGNGLVNVVSSCRFQSPPQTCNGWH